MDEFDLIEQIATRIGKRPDVDLGIGDDAALLRPPSGQTLVACCDTLNAGVHFPVDAAPFDIGWKALAVNLSDLAAMAATPAWVLLSLALPKADAGFVEAFLDGFCTLADRAGVALVGGDTTHGPLSITVTALGLVPEGQALRRSGAQVGDLVCVSGSLGDAAAALHLHHAQVEADTPAAHGLRQRLQRPEPRLALGRSLRGLASAAIDVSDGLLADLGHIAHASGVGIALEASALPGSPALRELFDPAEQLRFMATGGDDYELAFCLPPQQWQRLCEGRNPEDVPLTCIGQVREGEGVIVQDADGAAVSFPSAGWRHFGGDAA